MSLPAPNLDDRKFQDIVDEVKRRIASRCPEWTEHNVSDPGVTMIELFAGIADMMLYRFNQIPERNFVKYLELIGVRLVPPKAATTQLRFRLARPLSSAVTDSEPFVLPAYSTTVATPRTESEEAIEFSTIADLVVNPPVIARILTASDGDLKMGAQVTAYDADKFSGDLPSDVSLSDDRKALTDLYFPVFGDEVVDGNSLYVGFGQSVAGHLLEIQVDGLSGAAPKLRPENPLQVWEYWSSTNRSWCKLEVVEDHLAGFNVMQGRIEVAVPWDSEATTVANVSSFWIRCRYTTQMEDLPNYSRRGIRIDPYVASPRVRNVRVTALGGTVEASHCTAIFNEFLGESDGTAGQVFSLANRPVLDLELEEKVVVADPVNPEVFSTYERVSDFADSEESSLHFVFDAISNEITFGPAVVQPDGQVFQHGAIPPKGFLVSITRYRVGGGVHGNLAQGALRVLKESRAVASVTNVTPAVGGQDREGLERAKLRAVGILKVRERAVTREDFEYLACEVSGVARAACLAPSEIDSGSREVRDAHSVQVLVIPTLPKNCLIPDSSQLALSERLLLRTQQHLEARKLLTTLLHVRQPDYVYISTQVQFVVNEHGQHEHVANMIETELYRFIHPLFGGFDGRGWPFGKALTVADIYASVATVRGVAFLTSVRVFTSRLGADGIRTTPVEVDVRVGVPLSPTEMFVSRQHTATSADQWMVEQPPTRESERMF